MGVKVGDGRDSVCSWWGLIDFWVGEESWVLSKELWTVPGTEIAVESMKECFPELSRMNLEFGMRCSSVSWNWACTQLNLAQPWFLHLLNRDEHSAHLSGLLCGLNEITYCLRLSPVYILSAVIGLGLKRCGTYHMLFICPVNTHLRHSIGM